MVFISPIFFSCHISANNVPYILKSREPVGDVHIEGSVSRNLNLSFYFV